MKVFIKTGKMIDTFSKEIVERDTISKATPGEEVKWDKDVKRYLRTGNLSYVVKTIKVKEGETKEGEKYESFKNFIFRDGKFEIVPSYIDGTHAINNGKTWESFTASRMIGEGSDELIYLEEAFEGNAEASKWMEKFRIPTNDYSQAKMKPVEERISLGLRARVRERRQIIEAIKADNKIPVGIKRKMLLDVFEEKWNYVPKKAANVPYETDAPVKKRDANKERVKQGGVTQEPLSREERTMDLERLDENSKIHTRYVGIIEDTRNALPDEINWEDIISIPERIIYDKEIKEEKVSKKLYNLAQMEAENMLDATTYHVNREFLMRNRELYEFLIDLAIDEPKAEWAFGNIVVPEIPFLGTGMYLSKEVLSELQWPKYKQEEMDEEEGDFITHQNHDEKHSSDLLGKSLAEVSMKIDKKGKVATLLVKDKNMEELRGLARKVGVPVGKSKEVTRNRLIAFAKEEPWI